MDSINSYTGIIVTAIISIMFISYITGSYILSAFFVLAFTLFGMNIKNYEVRDDSLMLNSLLYSSIALGFLTLIMFVNSNYFGKIHRFHSVLALFFLLGVSSSLINAGTLSVALSN
jgi:hypothetical protein